MYFRQGFRRVILFSLSMWPFFAWSAPTTTASTQSAKSAAKPLTNIPIQHTFTIPQVDKPPTVDGIMEAREWTSAAILPPLARSQDNVVQDNNTQVHLAWQGNTLYFGLEHHRPQYARDKSAPSKKPPIHADALQNSDHVELLFSLSNRETAKLVVSQQQSLLLANKTRVESGWSCKSSATEIGWQAEGQVPFALLGVKNFQEGCELSVVRHEPSLDPNPYVLATRLRFNQETVACRFIEAGEYSDGWKQGGEIEIINAGAKPAKCSLAISLKGEGGEINRVVNSEINLPADSRRRYRLASSWQVGQFNLNYEIHQGTAALAAGQIAFTSGGPLRIELLPYFLWHGGIFVKAEALMLPGAARESQPPANRDFTFKLLDPTTKKILAETSAKPDISGKVEGFLSTRKLPAGFYMVLAVVKVDGKTVALRKELIQKYPTPLWWSSKDDRS